MRRALASALIAVWCGGLGVGGYEVYAYATTSGATAGAPAHWPTSSQIPRDPTQPTLVMFVHPSCTCTRASLAELAEVERAAPRARIVVAFAADRDPGIELAGAVRFVDPGGGEARRFGALTSGQVVVYSADGELQFSGGITGSRGHVGDNIGRASAIAAIAGDRSAPSSHAVFGCELHDR